MRYMDSGWRDPQEALGTLLEEELISAPTPPKALRVQTGFFGAASLNYFSEAFSALREGDGHTRFIVGSNDGGTTLNDLKSLLAEVGPPRAGLRVGVVRFENSYFHPKVIHITRADDSEIAYIGSANLTESGVTSLHVEAGLVIDTKDGDRKEVLGQVAVAIDDWFSEAKNGLYEVKADSDLEKLVREKVLRQVETKNQVSANSRRIIDGFAGSRQRPLVGIPRRKISVPTAEPDETFGSSDVVPLETQRYPKPPTRTEAKKHWSKTLTHSDAQRKKRGNQRGAITLVQGDYRNKINQTTYFRRDLFGDQKWRKEVAKTGRTYESTIVPMNVVIDGSPKGVMDFTITDGSSRQADQSNYTAELHIEPIGSIIRSKNVEGKKLHIILDGDDNYWLIICDPSNT